MLTFNGTDEAMYWAIDPDGSPVKSFSPNSDADANYYLAVRFRLSTLPGAGTSEVIATAQRSDSDRRRCELRVDESGNLEVELRGNTFRGDYGAETVPGPLSTGVFYTVLVQFSTRSSASDSPDGTGDPSPLRVYIDSTTAALDELKDYAGLHRMDMLMVAAEWTGTAADTTSLWANIDVDYVDLARVDSASNSELSESDLSDILGGATLGSVLSPVRHLRSEMDSNVANLTGVSDGAQTIAANTGNNITSAPIGVSDPTITQLATRVHELGGSGSEYMTPLTGPSASSARTLARTAADEYIGGITGETWTDWYIEQTADADGDGTSESSPLTVAIDPDDGYDDLAAHIDTIMDAGPARIHIQRGMFVRQGDSESLVFRRPVILTDYGTGDRPAITRWKSPAEFFGTAPTWSPTTYDPTLDPGNTRTYYSTAYTGDDHIRIAWGAETRDTTVDRHNSEWFIQVSSEEDFQIWIYRDNTNVYWRDGTDLHVYLTGGRNPDDVTLQFSEASRATIETRTHNALIEHIDLFGGDQSDNQDYVCIHNQAGALVVYRDVYFGQAFKHAQTSFGSGSVTVFDGCILAGGGADTSGHTPVAAFAGGGEVDVLLIDNQFINGGSGPDRLRSANIVIQHGPSGTNPSGSLVIVDNTVRCHASSNIVGVASIEAEQTDRVRWCVGLTIDRDLKGEGTFHPQSGNRTVPTDGLMRGVGLLPGVGDGDFDLTDIDVYTVLRGAHHLNNGAYDLLGSTKTQKIRNYRSVIDIAEATTDNTNTKDRANCVRFDGSTVDLDMRYATLVLTSQGGDRTPVMFVDNTSLGAAIKIRECVFGVDADTDFSITNMFDADPDTADIGARNCFFSTSVAASEYGQFNNTALDDDAVLARFDRFSLNPGDVTLAEMPGKDLGGRERTETNPIAGATVPSLLGGLRSRSRSRQR